MTAAFGNRGKIRLSGRSMGALAKNYIRAHRLRFTIEMLAVAVVAGAVLWAVIDTLHLLPPRTVTMATGPEGGAYQVFGERYREFLAREGIELRLVPTEGALEDLNKLNDADSGVGVSFLQGGITDEQASPDLVSLGTVFYEPLWFFYRGDLVDSGTEGLRGRRISAGENGSGTRFLSLKLLARNGITEKDAELLALTPEETARKLLGKEIDAALLLSSYESPVVQQLLATDAVQLASFPRADAYVALYPFLNKVVVPAGLADLVNNRPPTNTVLVAPKASLVVRTDMHAAIQYLLLKAAEHIHSEPGIFHKAGEFPAAEAIDLPLSEQARQFYRSGQPFLQRHLPVWLAVLVGRLLVLLIPILGILYPLFRFVPALYGWKMRRRVYKLYDELRAVERVWDSPGARGIASDLVARLDELEKRADQLWVPVSSMGILYLFKEHIAQVRQRLETQEVRTDGEQ